MTLILRVVFEGLPQESLEVFYSHNAPLNINTEFKEIGNILTNKKAP
jgi:hypothetical protein